MGIRNAAKAIILKDKKILLNKCFSPILGTFYSLPGGGQNQYETMEEAVQRECLEETGYSVVPESFTALYEEIFTEKSIQERNPDYAHKILHIFRCTLKEMPKISPLEHDAGQISSEWIEISDLDSIKIFPTCIEKNMQQLISTENPLYLGHHFIKSGESV